MTKLRIYFFGRFDDQRLGPKQGAHIVAIKPLRPRNLSCMVETIKTARPRHKDIQGKRPLDGKLGQYHQLRVTATHGDAAIVDPVAVSHRNTAPHINHVPRSPAPPLFLTLLEFSDQLGCHPKGPFHCVHANDARPKTLLYNVKNCYFPYFF